MIDHCLSDSFLIYLPVYYHKALTVNVWRWLLPFDPNAAYPQVIDGKRACPREDSGGVGGYKQKIEILKDKKHEEYKEISEWIGIVSFEQLDLESFDPDDVIFRNPATELRRVQKAIEREFS